MVFVNDRPTEESFVNGASCNQGDRPVISGRQGEREDMIETERGESCSLINCIVLYLEGTEGGTEMGVPGRFIQRLWREGGEPVDTGKICSAGEQQGARSTPDGSPHCWAFTETTWAAGSRQSPRRQTRISWFQERAVEDEC